jgi:hypothetical protein
MRGLRLAALALALGSCALSQSVCYSQKADEKKGQSLPIQFNIGPAGFSCGNDSTPFYCYGIPVAVNGAASGTFWVDTYLTGYNAGTGFILWNNVADLGQATITHTTFTGTAAFPPTVTVTFSGDTNDGDGGTYAGTMTLSLTYYYSSGGGGKGGGGAGWYFYCTGGTISIKYP